MSGYCTYEEWAATQARAVRRAKPGHRLARACALTIAFYATITAAGLIFLALRPMTLPSEREQPAQQSGPMWHKTAPDPANSPTTTPRRRP